MHELIREYVHYNVLIESVKKDIESLQESKMTSKAIPIRMGKSLGSMFRDRLKEIQTELRKNGVHVWYEDAGESVYVNTSLKGVKDRREFKRDEIAAELDEKMNDIAKMIENIPHPDVAYKVDGPAKDPYA